MWSIRAPRFVPVVMLAAFLASACTEANAPTSVHESAGTVAFGKQDAAAPRGRGVPVWPAQLTARLNEERARIELRRAGNRQVLDSLKKVYEVSKGRGPKGKASTLLSCEPQPYAAETKIIGPEGGELVFGHHKISFAPGALTEPTLITAEAPSALLVEAEFSPHGLVFATSAELELSYEHCSLPVDFQTLRAVFLDDQDNIVEYPAAFDFRRGDKVVSRIRHFSKYAVAY